MTGVALAGAAALLLSSCSAMHLAEAMLGTSRPNEKIVGQLFAMGGGGRARIGPDGVARISVVHDRGNTLLKPAVIMVSRPGPIEILVSNNDAQSHLAVVLPSDGNMMALELPARRSGVARVNLGTPGMYLFGDGMGNHLGLGMMGAILVEGNVPQEARLDRPRRSSVTRMAPTMLPPANFRRSTTNVGRFRPATPATGSARPCTRPIQGPRKRAGGSRCGARMLGANAAHLARLLKAEPYSGLPQKKEGDGRERQ